MEKLNLYEKIQAVSLDVMNIEKDMTIGKGNYSYKAVSDTNVVLQVKKSELKHKLLSIPINQELVSSSVEKVVKENRESLVYIDNIKMTVRFIDLEDTTSFIDVVSFGKGVDPSDKGFGKASTYARKYALLNAYKIATGEDPDAEKSKDIKIESKDEKRDAVISFCMKNEKYKTNILSHFSLGSLDDLSDKEVENSFNQLKLKGKI